LSADDKIITIKRKCVISYGIHRAVCGRFYVVMPDLNASSQLLISITTHPFG